MNRSRYSCRQEAATTYGLENHDLTSSLALAEKEAMFSLSATKQHLDQLLKIITTFEHNVSTSKVSVPIGSSEVVEAAIKSFQIEYDKLRETLDGLAERSSTELTCAYSDLERDARFLTIMLFGRTRAGKSTTMEALTGGNGSSIGIGRQHTTTKIKAYYFPAPINESEPNYPCLRIVDTPGIEGFEGEELAIMAEKFVERSDHIFFLLTDDKSTSGELDRFGFIRTQGKEVTVLLNVKAADEDLDLLIEYPTHIFKENELEGHKRRISGYLQRHFDMSSPNVIPFHARSAWLSRSGTELSESFSSRDLEQASRIIDVEKYILQYIVEDGIYSRMRTPRDLLNSYIWSLKNELRPFAGSFKQMMITLSSSSQNLERGVERARRKIIDRFPLFRARFLRASDGIPALVDNIISSNGYEKNLNKQWLNYLQSQGVSDSVSWFVSIGQKDFEDEINEEIRIATIDFNMSNTDGVRELFDEYHQKEESNTQGKYTKAALRTGAGTGAALLTGWAIANWWNPSGWLAGATAALVTAAVGIGAEEIARNVTDEWERTNKRDLYTRRTEIIKRLRDHLWVDYRRAREQCDNWLDQSKNLYLETARITARPIQSASDSLWKTTVSILYSLDEVTSSNNRGLVMDILRYIVPEVASGKVHVIRVARSPKVMTKIVLDTTHNNINVLGVCIGVKGSRLRKISKALGGEVVHLIDSKAGLQEQVLQALGFSKASPNIVNLDLEVNPQRAQVKVLDYQKRGIIGVNGHNIRLASQVLNMKINIQEEL